MTSSDSSDLALHALHLVFHALVAIGAGAHLYHRGNPGSPHLVYYLMAFLDRGDVVCPPGNEPHITDTIAANMFWMSPRDFNNETGLTMRCATQEISCKVEKIITRINSSTLEIIGENSDTVKNLEVAEVIIKTKKPIAIKNFNDVEELGRFVLVHDENICAGGIITQMG